MSQRLNEYFVREAGEYLEKLERSLSLPDEVPDAEQLVRLAHGVRGSAKMAGAETIARLADRLEAAARGVLSNEVAWSEKLRRLSLGTVTDLQLLLGSLHEWGQDEEVRVREALLRWQGALEDSDAAPPPETGDDAVVPIAQLFHDDAGPHVISFGRVAARGGAAEAAREVVPVESLLLRGPAALRAAIALRPRLERLAGGAPDELRALHDELFDLLVLSGSEARE